MRWNVQHLAIKLDSLKGDKFLDVLFLVLCSQSFSKAIYFDQKKYSNQMNIHIFMCFRFGDGANGHR